MERPFKRYQKVNMNGISYMNSEHPFRLFVVWLKRTCDLWDTHGSETRATRAGKVRRQSGPRVERPGSHRAGGWSTQAPDSSVAHASASWPSPPGTEPTSWDTPRPTGSTSTHLPHPLPCYFLLTYLLHSFEQIKHLEMFLKILCSQSPI